MCVCVCGVECKASVDVIELAVTVGRREDFFIYIFFFGWGGWGEGVLSCLESMLTVHDVCVCVCVKKGAVIVICTVPVLAIVPRQRINGENGGKAKTTTL